MDVGRLIWISVRPLLRLTICLGAGVGITIADIFPPIAARGAGQIQINIAIPSLMFSKIVPAFTADNVKALGPLVSIAILYQIMGIVLALLIKQVFWVPHRFRHGIIVAGGWANTGDIPTSVLLSIAGASPFNGSHDQTLAVAYLSAFILVFVVSLFSCGGHRLIVHDFVGPDIEHEEVRENLRQKRRVILYGWPRTISRFLYKRNCRLRLQKNGDVEPHYSEKAAVSTTSDEANRPPIARTQSGAVTSGSSKHVSFCEEVEENNGSPPFPSSTSRAPTEVLPSRVTSPTATAMNDKLSVDGSSIPANAKPTQSSPVLNDSTRAGTHVTQTHAGIFFKQARATFRSILLPPSISILLSFPIALITPLKALFVPLPDSGIPNAPDGQPPLAFIMDAAQFIGAASVPLGLICLGSALARLKIPKGQWRTLPWGAITSLAMGKMVVIPMLAVVICQALIRVGFISRDDKVLQLTCILLSALPTATTQITLTQVYSGTGHAPYAAEFLIPQYLLFIIVLPVLVGYTLQWMF